MAHRMIEVTRAGRVESVHAGHAAIADASGRIVSAWGDVEAAIYPRSSVKMIQALPLAEAVPDLPGERLALASASHEGAPVHVAGVRRWLAYQGRTEDALHCGPEAPRDRALRHELIRDAADFGSVHNNCSGKHAGFLHLCDRLGATSEGYCDVDHPVQRAVRAAFEDLTGAPSPGWGIDGCSAPNFMCTLSGLARAMARYAAPPESERGAAMGRLVAAMMAHPLLVAGEGRACTELMAAMGGRVAIKTGAEGVYTAILPERGLGLALKIEDGATRASEAAVAALLVHLGVLEADHPATRARLGAPILSRRGELVGEVRAAEGFV